MARNRLKCPSLAGALARGMLIAGALSLGTSCESPSRARLQPGDPVPALVLPALEQGSLDSTQWRGKTVVLNVWATWCGPCRAEMPSLERLSRSLDPREFQVIGISTDDDPNLAREFALKLGVTFPLAIDATGNTTRDLLGVSSLPNTLLISPDGALIERVEGFSEWTPGMFSRKLRALADTGPAAQSLGVTNSAP